MVDLGTRHFCLSSKDVKAMRERRIPLWKDVKSPYKTDLIRLNAV